MMSVQFLCCYGCLCSEPGCSTVDWDIAWRHPVCKAASLILDEQYLDWQVQGSLYQGLQSPCVESSGALFAIWVLAFY
jgi:hypothetical protein